MNNSKNSQKILASTLALVIMGMVLPPAFAQDNSAQIGTDPDGYSVSVLDTSNLVLEEPQPIGSTFFGNGGYSADGLGQAGGGGTISAEIPAGSTVEQAYLYAATAFNPGLSTLDIMLDGQTHTLAEMTQSTYNGCCNLESFVHSSDTLRDQVQAKFVSDGPGIIDFTVDNDPASVDGVALVVIFSNPSLPQNTIAVLDGGLSVTPATTTLGLAAPLDTSVLGFSATLALGISFSAQDQSGFASDQCGIDDNQGSTVDINGQRLTSCAGNFDDADTAVQNGVLFTVGGIGDSTSNPDDPNQFPADGDTPRTTDDELYDLEPLLTDGITQIDIETANASEDDLVFLAIISITAQASVGEICGNGIDDDGDGQIDEGCTIDPEICDNGIDDDGDGLIDTADPDCAVPQPKQVGGEFVPLDSTALLIAGMSANLGLIAPIVAGIAGASAYYIKTRMSKE